MVQFLFFLGVGLLGYRFNPSISLQFSSILFLGIGMVSLSSLLFCFFFPTNLYYELGLLLFSVLGWVVGWKYVLYLFRFKRHFFYQKSFLLLLIFTIALSSFTPFILDHFGYYVPTLEVLNSRGIVKGIVNLDFVLGQNSLWHILQSSLDEGIDTTLRLNALLLLVYLFFVFEKGKWQMLLFMPLFAFFIQGPSPDLATFILSIVVVFSFYFEKNNHLFFLFFLSCLAFCIKPTSFWLALFIGIEILKKSNLFRYEIFKKKHFIWLVLSSVLVTFSLVKNYISSSNFLFPLANTYLHSFWKPNENMIAESARIAAQKSFDFEYSYEQIEQFTLLDKLLAWLNIAGFKGWINIIILVIIILYSLFIFRNQLKKYYLISFLMVFKVIIVLLFSAQYRFILDVILVMLMLVSLNKPLKLPYKSVSVGLLGLVFFIFLLPQVWKPFVPHFKLSNMFTGWSSQQVIKPLTYNITVINGFKVGNLRFNVPVDYTYLYDTPFAGISKYRLKDYYAHNIFPQWKEGAIAMVEMDDSMKKELDAILRQLQ